MYCVLAFRFWTAAANELEPYLIATARLLDNFVYYLQLFPRKRCCPFHRIVCEEQTNVEVEGEESGKRAIRLARNSVHNCDRLQLLIN